jgi:7-cyano-7-deazaguanine synthase in queuosine biosynthesis
METPLLELTDLQLLELGTHMQVPWNLAWSCDFGGESPCMACAGCWRRHAEFETAGLVDPIEESSNKRPIAVG